LNGVLEKGQASGGVDDVLGLGFGLVNDSVSAICGVVNAAEIRNFSKISILPIFVVNNSAAFQFMLDNVPSFSHALEIIFAVILLSFLHAISDDFADVILVDVNGDGHTDHAQEDQGHHDSIGVNHTRIFSTSSATSKETDEKHDSSNDDQDHRGVQVGVSKEVQVLVHLDLDVGANADKSHRAEEDHEVEEKDDILDDVVTTTHLEFSVLRSLELKHQLI